MRAEQIILIFLLPVLIFFWGLGWVLSYFGEWIEDKSKAKYNYCLIIIKGENE